MQYSSAQRLILFLAWVLWEFADEKSLESHQIFSQYTPCCVMLTGINLSLLISANPKPTTQSPNPEPEILAPNIVLFSRNVSINSRNIGRFTPKASIMPC